MSPRELPAAGHRCTCQPDAQRPPVAAVWPPPSEHAPRGWYRNPDRRSTAQLRFWDGHAWTERTRVLTMTRIEHKPPGDAFTNLMLTVLTMGLWSPVWMVRASHRYRIRH